MRSEQEIFELILNIAKEDERIRAVYMNGSRVNPNIKKDMFQDYDIVYVVTETESFITDKNWISLFGELAIVQEPDSKEFGWGKNHDIKSSYGWLMLFEDYNRIDLHIEVKEVALNNYYLDTLTLKLLDKDDFLPDIPYANDKTHWIKQPSKETYLGCCNEFWWCLNNVAKGIARNQMPYAMRMYNEVVHKELDKMIEWYIALNHDFTISTGMWGKYFKDYLPLDYYNMYLKTYTDCNLDNIWQGLFIACELFRIIAVQVSHKLGYAYNHKDDENITLYINWVRNSTIIQSKN